MSSDDALGDPVEKLLQTANLQKLIRETISEIEDEVEGTAPQPSTWLTPPDVCESIRKEFMQSYYSKVCS